MPRQDAQSSQRLRRILFAMVTVTMLFGVVCVYLMGNAVLLSNVALARQQLVIDHLKDAISTVKDAETGQRGYILTGEDSYLAPYRSAIDRVHTELDQLSSMAEVQGLEAVGRDSLKSLANTKLLEMQQTIDLRKTRGFDAALALIKTNAGKATMDSLRGLSSEMIRKELLELNAQKHRVAGLTVVRTLVFVVTTLLNLCLLGWAFLRIDREAKGREESAAAVLQQKELLAVTLASIGDGVIVTDAKSTITFMNEVAEKLSGWTLTEALGQPCIKIFNIINESSRELVESPVDKVLRLGVVVGLANHTLLIRKDGTELPIDDSGAPVKSKSGDIQGVVLIFRDFSGHKQAEKELVAAKEAAEDANIAKDNFLATLSHELRTPLTPVLATLASWETSSELPPALLPDVQMLRRNVDLEARLIDDLLDLTRIVRGKLSLNPEVADLHELIKSVASMYQSEIHTKRLNLSLDLQAQPHFALVDPARLQQVFWNILKNATKFTREGGKIELSTSNPGDGQIQITFRDDGIGMTSDLLTKLFLPFEQGTDETVRRYGGLGLGLAISKALMDAQGGSIAADSAGPGSGSTFTLALPTAEAPKRQSNTVLPADSPTRSLTILLVEDHADTARVMSRLLRVIGHKVHVGDSVAAALASAAAHPIELIISDIGLPDGTGIDLIRKIRQTSSVPAIALTGFGMEEDVAKCKQAGFDDHLTKPVNLQKLELAIRQLGSRRKPTQ